MYKMGTATTKMSEATCSQRPSFRFTLKRVIDFHAEWKDHRTSRSHSVTQFPQCVEPRISSPGKTPGARYKGLNLASVQLKLLAYSLSMVPTSLTLLLSFFATSIGAVSIGTLDVYVPPIISPVQDEVWKIGQNRTVKW